MSAHVFRTATIGGKRRARCVNCLRGFADFAQLFIPPCDRKSAA